eukprot:TRINITY_DN2159_c0_g2_i3.p1 TRINITY_DN2159_c0_g2~~TRINITY_DN2159_c0_g2_i3.p1  ORF type:complete len:280 (+),score=35.25 TRINITY_DN2159_c0_g2_i3:78-917(+)
MCIRDRWYQRRVHGDYFCFNPMNLKSFASLLFVLVLVKGSQLTHEYLIDISRDGENYNITPRYITPQRTLIWLHGLGNSSAGFLPFFKEYYKQKRPNFRVVLVTAPIRNVTVGGGRQITSWFDIKDFDITIENFQEKISVSEVEDSASIIRPHIDRAVAYHNNDSKKVFIGGFSQGCCMSLFTGLQFGQTLGGILAFSGFLFPIIEPDPTQESIPILLSHGKVDKVIQYNLAVATYERLRQGKHSFFENFMDNIGHVFEYNMITVMEGYFNQIDDELKS